MLFDVSQLSWGNEPVPLIRWDVITCGYLMLHDCGSAEAAFIAGKHICISTENLQCFWPLV